MRLFLSLFFLISTIGFAQAEIKTKVVNYKHGKAKLQGFLAYDDAVQGKRPGILVVHEWWGHGDYVRARAKQLAELGYIAFALDMYGKGILAKDHKRAAELSGLYKKDRKFMRARANAGLKILQKHKLTDTQKTAAIGYCFGGTTVLEMARGGLDLDGVVSFHGGLGTPNPEKTKDVKPRVLVFHGANDGFMTDDQVQAFKKEMKQSGADWELTLYGGAVHSFTVEAAGNDPSKGMAYHPAADRRSWASMKAFLAEIFH